MRLALALVILAAATPVAAEINVADSVEWMTADADLVVRGRVTSVRTRKGPGSVLWHEATLAVDETLKGKHRATVRFAMRHLHGPTPTEWRAHNTELLLYLVDSKRRAGEDPDYAKAPFAIRADGGSSTSAVALTGKRIDPVFAADFSVARTRGAILAAARGAARRKAPRESARLDVPVSTAAFRALYGGSAVWLIVPAKKP